MPKSDREARLQRAKAIGRIAYFQCETPRSLEMQLREFEDDGITIEPRRSVLFRAHGPTSSRDLGDRGA
jgi:hypothetical protein